ncbi:MAG: hypothetical protein HQL32_04910 [Planctomycetes bacterium]|nr:hypothetical protein [Planctomycetota bacterium]
MTILPGGAAHGDLDCVDCHTQEEYEEDPHGKVSTPVSCGECHEDESDAFAESNHYKVMVSSSSNMHLTSLCLTCHGSDPHKMPYLEEEASATHPHRVSETCMICHEKHKDIDVSMFKNSIHHKSRFDKKRGANCVDCHGAHGIQHSSFQNSKTNHTQVPSLCKGCHEEETEEYLKSSHWMMAKKGFVESPVCTNCHSNHGVHGSKEEISRTSATNASSTCIECHGSESIIRKFRLGDNKVESFNASYHGLSNKLGDKKVAHCASCHESHKVLPSSDLQSSVHPQQLAVTCGKCHEGLDDSALTGKIHSVGEEDEHVVVGLARYIYIILIILTIGGMLFHNFLDLLYKSTKGHPYQRERKIKPRFSRGIRVQHFFLSGSFIALAWSGFVLAYPDSIISKPIIWLESGAEVRYWIHRTAAGIFCLVSLYHLVYLAVTKDGRRMFWAFIPRICDLSDAFFALATYLGLSKRTRVHPQFNYVEKAEYWALVWGSIIMTVSGAVLLFNTFSMAVLPIWVLDLMTVVHFWEAVLATLAILVWHGYWVFFDPEHYPMNMTWLIGDPRPENDESSEGDTLEEHGSKEDAEG